VAHQEVESFSAKGNRGSGAPSMMGRCLAATARRPSAINWTDGGARPCGITTPSPSAGMAEPGGLSFPGLPGIFLAADDACEIVVQATDALRTDANARLTMPPSIEGWAPSRLMDR
jgi:hypothetical protein